MRVKRLKSRNINGSGTCKYIWTITLRIKPKNKSYEFNQNINNMTT